MLTLPKYVLITPARNEARFIELTIKSVVAQTVRPARWIIVSDGSTDATDEIVTGYAAEYDWIELIRMPERRERNFAGKAHAFNKGYARVAAADYGVIGNLDADVSFEADHFEFLVAKFAEDPRLGVAGAPFREGSYQYDYRFTSIDNVWGGCQLFRRECFEMIGGYLPMKGGGIDLVAVVTARIKGWRTRTYPERVCVHHRQMNSAMNKGLKLKFNWGQSDYRLGSHPVWQLFRCIYQMRNPPYIAGGLLTLAGYYFALVTRRPRSVSAEFASFRGKEQMQRLKGSFIDRLLVKRTRAPVTPRTTAHSSSDASARVGEDGSR